MDTLIKFGVRATIVGLMIYYGAAYVATGVSNRCWDPAGCINPADVASYKTFLRAPNAYGGRHS